VDLNQSPTIAPDKTIKVEVWTTSATGGGGELSPQHYLDLGYDVVASPSDTLDVTPGSRLVPDPKFLYEEWAPQEDPHLWGYQISVWADNAITQTDSAFDDYLRRPREAMADRVWGGPRRGDVADLFERADAIGTPPGVPEYTLPGTLTGTPYGTSPAGLAAAGLAPGATVNHDGQTFTWPDVPTATPDNTKTDGHARQHEDRRPRPTTRRPTAR